MKRTVVWWKNTNVTAACEGNMLLRNAGPFLQTTVILSIVFIPLYYAMKSNWKYCVFICTQWCNIALCIVCTNIITLISLRHFSTCVGYLQAFLLKLKELFLRYFAESLYCDFYLRVNFYHLTSYIYYSDIHVSVANTLVICDFFFSYLSWILNPSIFKYRCLKGWVCELHHGILVCTCCS
jgi:hypothetical protein